MGAVLGKDSIDLGIVVTDSAKALAFYRDTLGLEHVADMPLSTAGGTMHRLMCGTTVIKLVVLDEVPAERAAPGGIQGATGYRYWTITVSNLEEVVRQCRDAGYKIALDIREARPGLRIAMVEDPDGNWVECIQPS